MSTEMVKCPGCHDNSLTQKFCGECGASLVGLCPQGHLNPEGQPYCGECGSSIQIGIPYVGEAITDLPPQFPIHLECPLQPDEFTKANTIECPDSPAEAPTAIPVGSWFSGLSPAVQTLISTALVVPALAIPLGPLREHWDELVIFPVSLVCFMAVLAIVARSRQRRKVALLVAGITGAIAFVTVFPAASSDLHIKACALAILVVAPLGFVAAWSIARRNHAGCFIGLLLVAPLVSAVGQPANIGAFCTGQLGARARLICCWPGASRPLSDALSPGLWTVALAKSARIRYQPQRTGPRDECFD